MKKLFIHIGLSKTGSSAIQSWLSLNVNSLREQGIDYADLSPVAKQGKITAGNGVALFQACNDSNWLETERLLTQVYFQSNNKALISSETLQNISVIAIEQLNQIAIRHGIEVKIIAYARSAYELLYSNYQQGIKRHGFTFKFGEKQRLSYKPQREFLENYYSVFGHSLVVVNYDHVKGNIFDSFAEQIDIDSSKMQLKDKRVNRSLTFTECELLRLANARHKGLFSTAISDFLIDTYPDIATPILYSEPLLTETVKNAQSDIDWVNDTLTPIGGTLSVSLDCELQVENDNNKRVVDTIVTWCFGFSPDSKSKPPFVDFLRDFANDIVNIDIISAYRLMALAHHYRPKGPYIKKRLDQLKSRVLKEVKVGIGVITYNRLELLKDCLSGLKQHTKIPHQFLVADDGSEDGTHNWCTLNNIPVIGESNKGVVWNKNRALWTLAQHFSCDVVILLEDDCIPNVDGWEETWVLSSLIWGHINYAHKRILAHEDRVVSGNGTEVFPYITTLVAGHCTACSKQAIDHVGYLNTQFVGYGHGHVEWTLRFLNHGFNGLPGQSRHVFANLDFGLNSIDAPSFRDIEQQEKNRKIKQSLQGNREYQNPWSSKEEQQELSNELERVFHEHPSFALQV